MQNAYVVVDLGNGDSSKGSIVDWLTREHQAHTVIRFNGGAQAAHNVVLPDGRHHTFRQFGSGTLAGAATHLSEYMLINPMMMYDERELLMDLGIIEPFTQLTIDEAALITTPFHLAANWLREIARGSGIHGSCGLGIGETMQDMLDHGGAVLRAGDLGSPEIVEDKLHWLCELKRKEFDPLLSELPRTTWAKRARQILTNQNQIRDFVEIYVNFARSVQVVDSRYVGGLLQADGTVVLEAAQGVLLDEWHGFHPYTTWSTTTTANALELLEVHNYTGDVTRLGLLRGYATRHGAGPFVSEDKQLSDALPDQHNTTNAWQREFRVGHFDLVATRYALEVCLVDQLVITCLDRLQALDTWRVTDRYQPLVCTAELEEHCSIDEAGLIEHINPHFDQDLLRQACLSEVLTSARPHNRITKSTSTRDGKTADYLTEIELELGVPITLTSTGTTYRDKNVRL